MRIAILWTHLSGYMNACLHELAAIPDVSLFVAHMRSDHTAPYDGNQFEWMKNRYAYDGRASKSSLLQMLQAFQPDVQLVCSWHIPAYRYALARLKGRAVRILFMDNPWRGTLKQWLGVLNSSWYIRHKFDAVFLPGERQAVFARKLGFAEWQIIRGGYSCDHRQFSSAYKNRKKRGRPLPNAFIFVGRFEKEKGIEVLVDAYKRYRHEADDPWPLHCCGEGSLRRLLAGVIGVEMHGFAQPRQLPGKFALASCLVLPSLFEPWGVVIHEAAASGLAIICTCTCGASVHLVQHGYNGYVVESRSPAGLASAMLRYTCLDRMRRKLMSDASFSLSEQFTPTLWSRNLYEAAKELMEGK